MFRLAREVSVLCITLRLLVQATLHYPLLAGSIRILVLLVDITLLIINGKQNLDPTLSFPVLKKV